MASSATSTSSTTGTDRKLGELTHVSPSYPGPGHIKTAAGWVAPLDLSPGQVSLTAISQALSNICRYGGHLPSHYSVAEHSLYVSNVLMVSTEDPRLALCGLLHDASEAYMGDMVRPVKDLMPEFREAEDHVQLAIADAFGLFGWEIEQHDVKVADTDILKWEMAMVRDCPWRTPQDPGTVRDAYYNQAKHLTSICRLPCPD